MVWKALDQDEGPTLWVRKCGGPHTFELATGRNPEAPIDTIFISADEIATLAELADG